MWPKTKLIQDFMLFLVTCKIEEDPLKRTLEWSQQISHSKSMQIFPDPQVQLTPQSKAGSTYNSNSSKL